MRKEARGARAAGAGPPLPACPGRDNLPGEKWLPVPDWPYEVSSEGRVWSVERNSTGGVLLTPWLDGKGYPCVTLRDGWRKKNVRVHRLVKRVHTGPPRGRQVRHVDDVKTDSRLAKLKYGNQKLNERDKRRNQGQREGERTRERGGGKEGIERLFEIAGASRVRAVTSLNLTLAVASCACC